jgi:hypothetical protein
MYDPKLQVDLTNKYEQVQHPHPYPPASPSMVVMVHRSVSPNFCSFKISFQEYLKKRSDVHRYDSNGNSGISILFIYI